MSSKVKWYHSISVRIPMLLLLFAAIAAGYSYLHNNNLAHQRVENTAKNKTAQLMSRLQGTLEYLVNINDFPRVQEEIASLGSDETIEYALLIDDNNHILASLERSHLKQPLEQTSLESNSADMKSLLEISQLTRKSLKNRLLLNEKPSYLLATYPVFLGSEADSLRALRYGTLILKKDLSLEKRIVSQAVANQLTDFSILLGLMVGLLSIITHFTLTSRVNSLVETTMNFATGDYDSRAMIQGKDEFSSIGRAFDNMAKEVATAHSSLVSSERKVRLLLESTKDAILAIDLDGICTFCNPATASLLGFQSSSQIQSQPISTVLSRSGNTLKGDFSYQSLFEGFERGKTHASGELFLHHGNDKHICAEYRAFPILSNGETVGVVLSFTNITDRKISEQRIERLAHYDLLTGLPNRALFNDRLEKALQHTRRSRKILAVLFIDLDRFKSINDSLGHAMGDQYLQTIADRLKNCLRSEDTVARIGGDEFTIILENLPDEQVAISIANKIITSIAEPLHLEGNKIIPGASIGISLYPNDGENGEALLKNADTAMYQAKASGRNRCVRYAKEQSAYAEQRFKLEQDLRNALEQQQFILNYQPLVSIDGPLLGAEVLVRWQHPDGHMIPPLEFLDVAREIGIIATLDNYVLRRACEQAAYWQQQGMVTMRISVNLSGVQINDGSILTTVEDILRDTGLDPGWLELEITEGFIMSNPDRAISTLTELRKLGISLAIDDFGTGHSSLGYLKRLPVNRLKVDRSFINDINTDKDDKALVATILAMAQHLNLEVLAEGVEDLQQLETLKQLGCREIQGYYISRPLDREHFEHFLQHTNGQSIANME